MARQLQTLLTDTHYAEQMKPLRAALRQAGGASLAADIVEQAMLTRQPVLNGSAYATV